MRLTGNDFEYEVYMVEDNSIDILQNGRGVYKKYSEDDKLPDVPKYKAPLFITQSGEYIERNGKDHIVGVVYLDGVNYLTITSDPYNYVL